MKPSVDFTRTLLYGEGLFETILWRGKTEKLMRHYRRLLSSARFFRIPCPSFEEFVRLIEEHTGGKRDLYVKFCLISEGDTRFDAFPESFRTAVIVKPYRKIQKVRLTVSSFRRHSKDPLLYHKTMNYLFSVLVKRKALSAGYDDAVILNEMDEITECSSSNIIFLKDDLLMTPSVQCGLLRGTTLELLMERFDIKEVRAGIEELLEADAVFVTNSISGAVPVIEIMDTPIPVRYDLLEDLNRAIEEDNTERDIKD